MDFEKEAAELCVLVYGERDRTREQILAGSLRLAHANGVLEGIQKMDEAMRKIQQEMTVP